jgi:type I restriction enzyme S subunit
MDVIDEQLVQTQELKNGLMQRLLTKGLGHATFKDSPLGEIPESWEAAKLNDLVKKVGSGVTPQGGRETYLKEGVLFIRSQNVLFGKLKLDDVAFISRKQHDKMSNSHLMPHDVLLNITGASIGRSSVVPETIREGNVNQHVCIIRTNDKLDSQFLCEFLNSGFGQKQIDTFQAGGNRQGLNFQQIRSFNIPLPSIVEQRQIAEILTTVDDKLQVLTDKKAQYQELKRGLMQQLLTGQRRVRVAQPEDALA